MIGIDFENYGELYLMEKVILEWKDGERTWCKDHWEYADGCSPLEKCLVLAAHDLSKGMDLLHQWIMENGGYKYSVCTNNQYEAELEKEWVEDRIYTYSLTKGKKAIK